MHSVRLVLGAALAISLVSCAFAQDSAASRPATDTRPESRPAEVRLRHPKLGVRCETLALERDHVARVEEVKPGSPAEKAGIKVGDVILKIGTDEIRDDKSYREAMNRRKSGETVTVRVRRGTEEPDLEVTMVDKLPRTEPDAVVVQQCLIKCSANPTPGRDGKQMRTVDQARKVAEEIVLKVKNGADFDQIVKSYSEDQRSVRNDPPGSYTLVNDGKPKPDPKADDRSKMWPGFSAVAFALDVGDVAVAAYDSEISPEGFHIIKRIK
jgi:membrane-associated protease RseP (regulator of RpoE activity)